MDKNKFLIDLSESARTDFGRVDFSQQSDEQQVFSAIWELESQVNNGGFEQYFSSESCETADFAPTALRRIGAHQCAEIVAKALRVVSHEPLPKDPATRSDLIASLGESQREELESLDSEFFSYPDDLTGLLFEFVRAHPNVFGAVT
jgi:PIN domain nuclease of toxin-antitoxin system